MPVGAVDVVIPTLGRPSLRPLLTALGDVTGRLIVVDDRRDVSEPLGVPAGAVLVRGRAAGPAAARNDGWRAARSAWVAFLDDDVLSPPGWYADLLADLADPATLEPEVAGSQGRIVVPLPGERRPTDWERNVAGLQAALWATADMAYRRSVLEEVGGFDERFPRAYREDADLGLRVLAAGYRIVRGARRVTHPVRPTDWQVSLRLQRGNADDPLMRALHGRGWRRRAGVPRGRRPAHLATTAAGLLGAAGLASGRRGLAAAGALGYAGGAAELAWRRIAPGPRTPAEVATMVATSAVLPAVASYWYLAGWLGLPRRLAAGR